eukprot:gene14630-6826_t
MLGDPNYLAQGVLEMSYMDRQGYTQGIVVQGGGGPAGQGRAVGGLDISEPVVQAQVQRTGFKLGVARLEGIWWPNTTHWIVSFYEFVDMKQKDEKVNPDNETWLVKADAVTGLASPTWCNDACPCPSAPWCNATEDAPMRAKCEAEGKCGVYAPPYAWYHS